MGIRTDLAMEAVEMYEKHEKRDFDGIEITNAQKDGFEITMMEVKDERGAEKIGKKKGKYLTIQMPGDYFNMPEYDDSLVKITADCLIKIMGETLGKTVFVAGLGNRSITADRIGPDVVDLLCVTRHIKGYLPDDIAKSMGDVCAVVPGVMGDTGIETGEIVKGVCNMVKPDMVICIDALAAKNVDRVNKTIQMCDCGISPGAGVGNNRKALDYELLGVPVYVIGVPTVVDAYSLVCDLAGVDELASADGERTQNFTVTPKDIDFQIKRISGVLARAVNLALVGEESI